MINNNYKIKHATEKALKIEMEGLTFWIPKAWIGENGTLSTSALKVYEEAKKQDQERRAKAKEKQAKTEEINIKEFIEQAISIGHENVDLSAIKFIWLKELTSLVALLFSHQKMRDQANQIFALDVWSHIKKSLKPKA